jgi:CheY-like chemotaxis protein
LGTTVRIYLPAAEGGVVSITSTEPSAEEPMTGTGQTVLVAEDDAFVRAYALSTISDLGYRVIVAGDGHEALSKLVANPEISLLFTDIVMPGGMSGWDLAARALEMRPDLKILLTSGYALETLASRGRIKPDVAFLTKPYRRPELSRRLHEVLAV